MERCQGRRWVVVFAVRLAYETLVPMRARLFMILLHLGISGVQLGCAGGALLGRGLGESAWRSTEAYRRRLLLQCVPYSLHQRRALRPLPPSRTLQAGLRTAGTLLL